MNKGECEKIVVNIPDYVTTVFWFFVTLIMISVIIGIIVFGLQILGECYQEIREAYLRNKQMKLEIEVLEKQNKE